jgi:hypothetical protein
MRPILESDFVYYTTFNALMLYSKTNVFCKTMIHKVYETFPFLKTIQNSFLYQIQCIDAHIWDILIEPPDQEVWTSISCLIVNYGNNIEKYKYEFEETVEIVNDIFQKKYSDYVQILSSLKQNNKLENVEETLTILKQKGLYQIFVCNSKKNDSTDPIEPEKSSCRFLSIDYHHHHNDLCIPLKIPKTHYFIGNELFSAAYILRYLNYQKEKYYYDFDYEIHIMDLDLNIIVLKSDEYIRLGKTTYEIIKK